MLPALVLLAALTCCSIATPINGDAHSRDVCAPHGVYNSSRKECDCLANWSGTLCKTPVESKPLCGIHGKEDPAKPGSCICPRGRNGMGCPLVCEYGTLQENGNCTCFPGFTSASCAFCVNATQEPPYCTPSSTSAAHTTPSLKPTPHVHQLLQDDVAAGNGDDSIERKSTGTNPELVDQPEISPSANESSFDTIMMIAAIVVAVVCLALFGVFVYRHLLRPKLLRWCAPREQVSYDAQQPVTYTQLPAKGSKRVSNVIDSHDEFYTPPTSVNTDSNAPRRYEDAVEREQLIHEEQRAHR